MEESVKNENAVEEIKFEEPKGVCEKSTSLVKDYFTEDGSGKIKELANLFGQSESELKKEFGVFKAKKVYKKLNYFIDTKRLLNADIIDSLNVATKYGFYGVTVYPTALPLAVGLLSGGSVKVRTIIDYPCGESSFKTLKCAIKSAIKDGANELLLCLSSYSVRNEDGKELLKKVKKLVKRAKATPLSIMLDTAILSRAEIENAIKTLLSVGANSFALTDSSGELDKNLSVEFSQTFSGKTSIECFDKIKCVEVAISTLLGGVNMLTTANCQELVLDFSKKINACEVEECQALDKCDKE